MKITIDKYKDNSREVIDKASEIHIGNDIYNNLNLNYFADNSYKRIELHKYDKIKIHEEE